MSITRKFLDEEKVYAKWPGSSLYYKGNVVSYAGNGHYNIKFENDDSTTTLATKDIQKEATMEKRPKSPARRSRSSSTGGGRRRRRRSKSPARKASRSPVERKPRSPARATKKVSTSNDAAKISQGVEVQRISSERKAVVQKAKKIMEELQHSDVEEVISNEAQFSHMEQSTTFVTQRTTRSVTRALSHDEETRLNKEEKNLSQCCTIKSALFCGLCCTGSLIKHLLIVVMPLFVIYGLYLSCRTSKSCTFLKIPTLPTLKKFFNWKSTGYVFGWYFFQLGLFSLPIGKRVTGPKLLTGKEVSHILNGFPAFVISMCTVLGLHYFGKLPVKYITVNYLSLITAAFIFALMISVVTLILSRKAGPMEPSDGILKDFVSGRITSPCICPYVNLKTFAFKTGFISWAALNFIYFVNLSVDWKENVSLVLLAGMQIFYILDKIIYEEPQLYTKTLMEQKIGFVSMFTSLVTFPFFLSWQARYLYTFPLSFHWSYYVIPALLAIIGLFIQHCSTMQKFAFRKGITKNENIYISTIDGKGLLCEGWWGHLRRPNYCGEIIQAVAWVMLCGCHHFLPWLNICVRIPMMIAIMNEDEAICRQKYKQSWTEYERRVPFKLIPNALLNLIYMIKVYEAGKLRNNTSFIALQAFQFVYILDGLFFEETLLYNASLKDQKIGFIAYSSMLIWFPFFCPLQVRYLSIVTVKLSWYCYVIPTSLQVIGYYIYRTSNLQKFLFRKDGGNKAKQSGISYICTSDGKGLLTDGWWGKLRHPNYTGDWLLNIGWSSLCGLSHLLPWLWSILLLFILMGMAVGDDQVCARKYGPSWREYKERVKYKIFPYIY